MGYVNTTTKPTRTDIRYLSDKIMVLYLVNWMLTEVYIISFTLSQKGNRRQVLHKSPFYKLNILLLFSSAKGR